MTVPVETLADARENLRAVFARYRLGAVYGCPCCVSADDQAAVRAGDFRRYAMKAMTTWGDADDFRHFLPALLDAAIYGDQDFALDTLTGKLQYAQWESWPEEEQEAVQVYLLACWRECLQSEPGGLVVSDFLLAVSAILSLEPFLALWQNVDSPSATLRFAEYLKEDSERLITGASRRRQNTVGEKQIIQFLRQAEVKARLEAAFFAAPDASTATRLSRAAEQRDWLHLATESEAQP